MKQKIVIPVLKGPIMS